MSEIFSPGSIAGPQGTAGAAGAAGSQGSVTALASSVLPMPSNLFDVNRVVNNFQLQSDGSVAAVYNWATSGMIFCPGATSMVTNVNIDPADGAFNTYDANGAVIATLPASSFGSAFAAGPNQVLGGSAFPLPGTQVYVRFCWVISREGSYYSVSPISGGMVFAATTGTAVLPGAFVSFAWETESGVDAKDAVVAASAASALAASLAGKNEMLRLFADAVLPNPTGTGRNTLDYTRILNDTIVNIDGTFSSSSGMMTALVFAPASTFAMCNLPIRNDPGRWFFALYDANHVFQQTLPGSYFGLAFNNGQPGRMNALQAFPLPGTQTYLAFCWVAGDMNPSANYAAATSQAMFLSGTTTPVWSGYVPYPGNVDVSIPVRTKTAVGLGGSTAAINAFLATASATNPVKLILDGMFTTTGLVLSPNGYTTIEGTGWGSGITVASGSNQDGIRIGAYTAATGNSEGVYNIAAPARVATNIILRDFTLDANAGGNCTGGTYAPANTPVVGAAAHSCYGAVLASCSNVLVENVNFKVAPTYALCVSNVGFLTVHACAFNSVGTIHDGVHIDGPSNDIAISDCYFATGDDAIALNAPEGYGGDISRVTVTNCRFNGSLTVMRAYTSVDTAAMPTNNTHKIRNVVVSNCTGNTNVQCFNIGITNGGLSATTIADQLQDFSVSNCTLSSPLGLAALMTPIGSITFSNVRFIPTSTTAVIWVWLAIGDLVLDGVTVLRNPDGNAAPVAFVSTTSGAGGAPIDRLSLLNCRVVDEEGSSYAALPCLIDIGGTVATLRLEDVDMAHITALVSVGAGWGNIAAICGGGVMGAGVQVPDSAMSNNALYLSSNAGGAPSIKVGGTAKRITLA